MNGFLTKPCGLDALRAEIVRWAPQSCEASKEHVA